jgi:hypothetical protein
MTIEDKVERLERLGKKKLLILGFISSSLSIEKIAAVSDWISFYIYFEVA